HDHSPLQRRRRDRSAPRVDGDPDRVELLADTPGISEARVRHQRIRDGERLSPCRLSTLRLSPRMTMAGIHTPDLKAGPATQAVDHRERIAIAAGAALLAAGLILVLFILPAEFAVDPLGTGAKLGLMQL